MTIYVDPLCDFGWKLRGRQTRSCHLFSTRLDLRDLHQVASRIGMRRQWFQGHASTPHYDLVPSRREAAVALGLVQELDRRQAVQAWQERRAARKIFLALWTDRADVGLQALYQALGWPTGTERELLEVVLQLKAEKE